MRRSLPVSRLPGEWLSSVGLTCEQAAECRRRFGANEIVEAPAHALWGLVLRQASLRVGPRGARDARPRTEDIVRRGIAMVPEGREFFSPLTVRENLLLGAYPLAAGRGEPASRMPLRVC